MIRVLIILLSLPFIALAQEEEKQSTEPTSFPNAIIIGNYNPTTGGGVKKLPQGPEPLSQAQLDSLNDMEKQRFLLLPPQEIPAKFEVPEFEPGYLRASFGSFITPQAEAGYRTKIDKFDLFLNGGLELSNGHVDNANYNRVFVGGDADYVAPEKFWIFGGSKTNTSLMIRNLAYNTYATDTVDNLNNFNLSAGVNTDGKYDGIEFTTGFDVGILSFSGDNSSASNTSFTGYANIANAIDALNMGVNAFVDLHSYNSSGNSFVQANAEFDFASEKVRFQLDPGVQLGSGNLDNSNKAALYIDSKLAVNLNKSLTMWLKAGTGLINNNFENLYRSNPWLAFENDIKYTQNVITADFIFNIHPYTFLGINAGAGIDIRNDQINMVNDSNFRFSPVYTDASILRLYTQAFWDINNRNRITFDAKLNISNQDSTDKNITYLPQLEVSGNYNFMITSDFGTNIGFDYIGSRYSDIANEQELESYINTRLEIDYTLTDNFKFFSIFNNILNDDIFIWNGYIERGLFAKLGILWKF